MEAVSFSSTEFKVNDYFSTVEKFKAIKYVKEIVNLVEGSQLVSVKAEYADEPTSFQNGFIAGMLSSGMTKIN